jgi:predicted nucleic acid-binding protein
VIVADTNLIAYLLVDGPFTKEARSVYEKDRDWTAPSLWRSEFRNVLIMSLRCGLMNFADALEIMEDAELLMAGKERDSASLRILRLAADAGCSAYDCEFVAVALDLGVPLVTSDRSLIEKFKPTAVSMKTFCL